VGISVQKRSAAARPKNKVTCGPAKRSQQQSWLASAGVQLRPLTGLSPRQGERLRELARVEPGKSFPSASAPVRYLSVTGRIKWLPTVDDHAPGALPPAVHCAILRSEQPSSKPCCVLRRRSQTPTSMLVSVFVSSNPPSSGRFDLVYRYGACLSLARTQAILVFLGPETNAVPECKWRILPDEDSPDC